jgi:hypothetical protein
MEMPSWLALPTKRAIVTGASRGIGRATAEALAKMRAHVGVHYGRSPAEADALDLAERSVARSFLVALGRSVGPLSYVLFQVLEQGLMIDRVLTSGLSEHGCDDSRGGRFIPQCVTVLIQSFHRGDDSVGKSVPAP